MKPKSKPGKKFDKNKSPKNLSKQLKNKKQVKFTPETKLNDADKEAEGEPKKFRDLTSEELTDMKRPENIKNVVSKRQLKREKYENLKNENKLKSTAMAQQKGLNYLSRWKHNKEEWKFEKLKQVWLQHNMFDAIAIPDKFWDVLQEYFSGSKGKVRQVIMKQCVDVIEAAEKSDKDKDDVKFNRARTLLQFLEE